MKKSFWAYGLCGLVLLLCGVAQAADYTVDPTQAPGETIYKTLEELRTAPITWEDGDTITIKVGSDKTLTQAILFGGKQVTITGYGTVSPATGKSTSFARVGTGDWITISAADGKTLVFTGFRGVISGDTITLSGNSINTFTGNAAGFGGAISGSSYVTLSDSSINTFTDNAASTGFGGAIDGSTVTLSGSSINTFTGNTAQREGGAIYGSGGVTLSGGSVNTFTGNTALWYGGAISGSSYVTLSGSSVNIFTSNTAGIYGGAISGGTITLSGSSVNTFTGNTVDIHGGAIYGYSGVTLSDSSVNTFTGNAASIGYGGAIHGESYVTLSGGTNTFINNKAATSGGAVYAGRNGTFIADGADLLFQGNTANNTANAIYMNNFFNNNTLILAAKEGYSVLLYDPVVSNSDGSNQNLTIRINSTNSTDSTEGRVVFDGRYWIGQGYDPTGNAAHFTSAVYGNTTVHGGTLALLNGVTYGAANTVGSFTLKDGATLLSNAAYANTIKAAAITLAENSILAFDMIGTTASTTNLTLSGATVSVGSSLNIDLLSLLPSSLVNTDVTLVSAGTTNFSSAVPSGSEPTYKGETLGNTRADGLVTVSGITGAIVLKQADTVANQTLTWTNGESNAWDFSSENWKNSSTSAKFWDGDAVIFDNTVTGTVVSINADGVTVAAMHVESGTYTFSGGGITASTFGTTLTNPSGKLTLSGGSVDFTGISGANRFAGGIDISGGRLTVASAAQLGTTLNKVRFTGDLSTATGVSGAISDLESTIRDYVSAPNEATPGELTDALTAYSEAIATARTNGTLGTITFADTATLAATSGSDQHLSVGAKAASFDIAAGKTLTIAGNQYSGNGAAVSVDTGGLFAVTGDGEIVFEGNTADIYGGGIYNSGTVSFSGPATFTNNSVTGNFSDGGGIENYGTVSFLGTATFEGNTTSRYGGGIDNWSGTVSFFGPATFEGNTASHYGGGISNSGTVGFSGPATFTNNSVTGDFSDGGGISNSGTVSFSGPATFENNTVAGNFSDGGGIYNSSSSAVSFFGPASFEGNTASRYGGGISNSGTVSFSGRASFEGNTASFGGGIGNQGGTVSFFDEATFKGNTASVIGGGIYNDPGTMSFSGPATFEGNTASFGGGISNYGTVSFSGPTTFTNNKATDTSDGSGGGIVNYRTVSFLGAATFEGNTATNSGGGIINYDTVSLTPTNADDTILFSGNMANNAPNAIYMSSSTSANAFFATTLNVGGAGTIDMRDPMAGNVQDLLIAITKSGTGTWYLGGANTFTVDADYPGKTTFTVSGGTLHLYRANETNDAYAKPTTGTITLEGTGSSFKLEDGATLSLGGVGHSITTDGTITLEIGSTLAFDMTGAVDKDQAGATTNLALSANAITGTIGVQTIDIVAASGLPTAGTYHLVNSAKGTFSDAGTLTLNGNTSAADRAVTKLSLTTAPNYLDLAVASAIPNTTLYWTGADTANQHIWVNFTDETSPQNWTDDPTGTATVTQFADGDTVIFDNTATQKTVAVDGGGVTVATMTISDSGYEFSGGAINGIGALAVNENVTFKNQFAFTSGATIADSKILTIDTSADWTLSSPVSGSGSLSKTGTGTLTLSGINTYSGGTTVSAGTLQIGNGSTICSLVSNIVNNAAVVFNYFIDFTYSGVVSGSGTVTKQGAGKLTLSGTNTYTGETTISGGTLALTGNGSIASTSGLTLSDDTFFDISGVTTSASLKALAGSGTVTLGDKNLEVGSGNTDTTYSGVISGIDGSLTKTGIGTLTLSGANTYSGDTTISAGILSVSADANLGHATGTITVNAGTLRTTDSFATARAITIADAASTIEIAADKILTLTGTMDGNGTLNKTGDGTLKNLGGFSGAVAITAGNIEVSIGTFDNVLSGSGTLVVNLAAATDDFSFGDSVGSNFAGTVRMMQGTVDLDNTINYDVFEDATLQLDANSSVTVTQDRTIKALTMNGGALKFDVETIAHDGILTVADLDTTGGGTIQMDVIQPIDTSLSTMENWYDYGDSASAKQHQLVSAAKVTGTGTQIAWQDYQGGALSSQIRTINDGTENVGTATFGYAGAIDASGITLGYTLTELSADSGKIVELDSTGATGTLLNAKLTGDGGFTFSGTTDVSVGSASSDYRGATAIDGDHAVLMLTDSAFGNTSDLSLSNAATLDMNGKTQTVGSIDVADTSTITVGTLNIADGGTIAGTLSGTGTTTQTGGTLAYSGTQNAGAFVQNGGTLNTASGATLNNATFRGTVNPTGTLNTATASFEGATITIGTDPGTNKIIASCAMDFTGSNTITLDTADAGTYTLLEGASLVGNGTVSINNTANLGGKRDARLDSATAITYKIVDGAAKLIWTGALDSNWNTSTINWKDSEGFAFNFANDDAVIFDGTASNKNVVVDTAGVTVASMEINDNYSFSGGTITATGEVSIAAGKSLGLNITGNAPILNAASVDFNGGSLNITGYATGMTDVFNAPVNEAIVITTTGGVNHFNPAVTVLNQASADFLSASARLSDDGRNVLVETGLTWYSTEPNRPAHGDFTIEDGETFTLGADLIDQSSNANWDGTSLTKEGSGTLILTGNNTYTGGTSVNDGTLTAESKDALGTGDITASGNGILVLEFEGEFANHISGTGTVDVAGDGIIFNNSTNVTIHVTGTLGGSSTHKSFDVKPGGTISPGNNGIGTMTVGSLTFESGSFYDVEVEPGGTGSDLLQVTGTAVLSGATVRHIGLGGTYSPIGEWTILTAGNALTDQFAGVESMYSFLDASLLYGSNDVKLQLKRNDVDFASKAKTPNQKAAAKGIESQGAGNQPYDYVVSQLNTADMGAIYDGFSGEMHAGLSGEIQKQDRYFTGQMLGRLGNALAGTTGVAGVASGALAENTDFWISVDGYKNTVDRTFNTAKTEFKGWGASLGVEREVAEWTFGAAFRYGDSEYKVDSLHSEADLDSFNFGLYAGRSISDFNIKFGAGYGLHQVDSKRRIVATGENLKADYDMNSFQVFGELGYLKEFDNFSLEPYAGLAWNYAKSDSFTEKGGPSALRAKSESNDNVTSSLGVRGHYKPLETVEIGADLNWQHVFGDENPEARFAFTGGSFFTIEGAPMDRDSLGLGLDMAIKVQDNLNVRAGYVGRFGEDTDSHAGFLSLEFSF